MYSVILPRETIRLYVKTRIVVLLHFLMCLPERLYSVLCLVKPRLQLAAMMANKSIIATGGTSPFQYSLNNVNFFTSNVFNNLAAGNYTAYVKTRRAAQLRVPDVPHFKAYVNICNLQPNKSQRPVRHDDGPPLSID